MKQALSLDIFIENELFSKMCTAAQGTLLFCSYFNKQKIVATHALQIIFCITKVMVHSFKNYFSILFLFQIWWTFHWGIKSWNSMSVYHEKLQYEKHELHMVISVGHQDIQKRRCKVKLDMIVFISTWCKNFKKMQKIEIPR